MILKVDADGNIIVKDKSIDEYDVDIQCIFNSGVYYILAPNEKIIAGVVTVNTFKDLLIPQSGYEDNGLKIRFKTLNSISVKADFTVYLRFDTHNEDAEPPRLGDVFKIRV